MSALQVGYDLVWVAGYGVGLGFLYWLLHFIAEILPLSDDRRAAMARLRPLVGVGFTLLFALAAAHALFARYPSTLPVALLLVLVGFFVGSRVFVSDFFAGVALRAEQAIQVGDHVRLGEIRGRVIDLGARTLTVATPDGDSALVPYSQAAAAQIVRTRAFDQSASLAFSLSATESTRHHFAQVVRQVERAALLHHWGSIARPPEVASRPDGTIEVTVFALSQDHADEIERAVRQAVAKLS